MWVEYVNTAPSESALEAESPAQLGVSDGRELREGREGRALLAGTQGHPP